MSNNPTRKRLSELQRCEIIAKLSRTSAPSKRSLAREYGVSEGAVRKVWENREAILHRSALLTEEKKETTFRSSVGRFTELEDMLYVWIDSMRRASLPVPPSLVIAKAKIIASNLSIPESDFKASWQWLSRFRVRHGLQKILLHGEGAEVNKNDPELLAALEELYEIISNYKPENVYNMDETGLFFRLLPRYSLLMPEEDLSTTRGKKKSKDRLSLIVCANATGSHKIPCTLIGKPKEPACIKDRQWPIPYVNQAKAWMDVETCWKWFNNVFFPEVKRRTGRSALLLLDNAPGHFQAFERDNIRVVFFPPNCTSWKQPCDMGIIAALKKRYKYLYLKDVLDFYQLDDEAKARKKEQARRLRRGSAGVLYGNPAHLLDAANYVKEAWDSVSEASIRNAFRKAEIMPNALCMEDEYNNNNTNIEDDMMNAFEELHLGIDSSELDEFIHADDENNEIFSASVLEDVEEVLETMNISEIAESEDDNEADPSHTQFEGFKDLYEQVLDIEDQLLCHEVQIEAGETYDDLKKSFEVFQNKLRTLMLSAKRKKLQNLRQMTIHDYYVR
jgi:hypothetical protein